MPGNVGTIKISNNDTMVISNEVRKKINKKEKVRITAVGWNVNCTEDRIDGRKFNTH